MSSSLVVKRKIEQPRVKGDFHQLKFFLREYFGNNPVNIELSECDLEELKIIAKANKEHRQAIEILIKEIEKGHILSLNEEW